MMTPNDVSSHSFTRAMVGGYNMTMVDEFLDEVTEDYSALYKENAALKSKLKVLVEKVEDYRTTEESMRATLLAAQKMADSIVREAEAQREDILAQAEGEAGERLRVAQEELEATEWRLRQGQIDLIKFVAATRELCGQELKLLERLPDLPVPEDAAAAMSDMMPQNQPPSGSVSSNDEETQSEPDLNAFRASDSSASTNNVPPIPEPLSAAAVASAATIESAAALDRAAYPADEPEEPTRRLNLSDLKSRPAYPRETGK